MRAEDRREFDPDAPRPAANSWFVPIVCGVQAATFLLLFWELVFVAPGFERTFKDFDATLPAISQLAFLASYKMASYWYLVALAWIGGVVALIAIHRSGARAMAWTFHWLVIVGALGFAAFAFFALWLPMLELMDQLS